MLTRVGRWCDGDVDAGLVRRLVVGQFPQWADLPIQRVPSAGTDNALYRLGDDLLVRLPRRPNAVPQSRQRKRDQRLDHCAPPEPALREQPGEADPGNEADGETRQWHAQRLGYARMPDADLLYTRSVPIPPDAAPLLELWTG